ncbi:MAG: hypothetical protein EBT44_06780 [Actinobacteria bacterium]|uniref:Uncharacterized protein n=1 Tax=Candidatus Fonsibacter lacus TaxID=2576439 RepID=A0A965LLL1_9PROT|nr:hypothetical protein [Candidatus Fonsibacter lacus]
MKKTGATEVAPVFLLTDEGFPESLGCEYLKPSYSMLMMPFFAAIFAFSTICSPVASSVVTESSRALAASFGFSKPQRTFASLNGMYAR